MMVIKILEHEKNKAAGGDSAAFFLITCKK